MFKRNLVILVGIMALLLAGSSQVLAGKKIVNGIDANFPPFAFIDKTGTPSGFDVEAMNWIAKEMGYKVTHQAFDWDGIVTSLLTRKIDMVADAAKAFKPKVIYPYHYGNTDTSILVNLLKNRAAELLFRLY